MTVTPRHESIYQNQGNDRSMQLTSSLAKLPRAPICTGERECRIGGRDPEYISSINYATLRLVVARVAMCESQPPAEICRSQRKRMTGAEP